MNTAQIVSMRIERRANSKDSGIGVLDMAEGDPLITTDRDVDQLYKNSLPLLPAHPGATVFVFIWYGASSERAYEVKELPVLAWRMDPYFRDAVLLEDWYDDQDYAVPLPNGRVCQVGNDEYDSLEEWVSAMVEGHTRIDTARDSAEKT